MLMLALLLAQDAPKPKPKPKPPLTFVETAPNGRTYSAAEYACGGCEPGSWHYRSRRWLWWDGTHFTYAWNPRTDAILALSGTPATAKRPTTRPKRVVVATPTPSPSRAP